MKRILLAIILGFIFGAVVFGQERIEMKPLVNFDGIFEGITVWFTDVLKKHYVLLLTVFFVWFMVMSVLSFLQGRMERWEAERRFRQAIVKDNLREKQESRHVLRQQQLEQSRVAEQHEVEYRRRELRDFLLRDRENLGDNEKIVQIDGAYYVRSETSAGDVIGHQTLNKWRAERDEEDSKPLDFDNNDYGRTYDSIVESDHVRDMFGERMGNDEEYREYKEESVSYEESELDRMYDDRWKKEMSRHSWVQDIVKESRCIREECDYGDDEFESADGHRRGEFRGGY